MYLSRVRVRGLRGSVDYPLEVNLPGRFSVIAGPNGGGKTTFSDAVYLGHQEKFPYLPRHSAAALGPGDRDIEVAYKFETDVAREGPLGLQLQAQSGRSAPGTIAADWAKTMHRSMGAIKTSILAQSTSGVEEKILLVHLPAWRNPLDELSRREARVLVELLRAQQQNRGRGRDLSDLRAHASRLLEDLATHGVLAGLEDRVGEQLRALSAGVSRKWPYIRGQVADDRYLARVLELMLASIDGRASALPLEVVALGYVNLLHIAVTLAAIPDAAQIAQAAAAANAATADQAPAQATQQPTPQPTADESAEAERILEQARAESESAEDSFFPDSPFHVTLLIEEPEAHLHPQLQHSLVRYLRRQVAERPELQVVLSSHATDIITSCDPTELVIIRRDDQGRPVSRAIADIPLTKPDEVLRKARLHLDASRSASLFADRVLLVEGVTEAAVLRELGWAWSGDDADKQAFIDALSIVPMGTKVGPWSVRLLATRGHELVGRVAVLRDSDKDFSEAPNQPSWASDHDSSVLLVEHSHPTLEPQLTELNGDHVGAALAEIGLDVPAELTAEAVRDIFRSTHKENGVTVKAGPGASRKGEFAEALAGILRDARHTGNVGVDVPAPYVNIFDFLYADPTPPAPLSAASAGGHGPAPSDAADDSDETKTREAANLQMLKDLDLL